MLHYFSIRLTDKPYFRKRLKKIMFVFRSILIRKFTNCYKSSIILVVCSLHGYILTFRTPLKGFEREG